MKKIFTTLFLAAAIATSMVGQFNVGLGVTRNLHRDVTYESYGDTYVVRNKTEKTDITKAGAIFAVGQATSDFDFAEGTVFTIEGGTGYLLKYNADGTEAWGVSIYGGSYVKNVVATNDEGVVVTGRFAGTIDVDGADGVKVVLTAAESADFYPATFIARYDVDGKVMWAKMYEPEVLTAEIENAEGVMETTEIKDLDQGMNFVINDVKVTDSKLIFTGAHNAKLTIAGTEYSTTYYDQWGALFPSFTGYSIVSSLETGIEELVLPLNTVINTASNAEGFGIETDATGNVYVANVYKGSVEVAGTDIAVSSNIDEFGLLAKALFVVKYDAAGVVVWTKEIKMPVIAGGWFQYILKVADMKFNSDGNLGFTGNYSGEFTVAEGVSVTSIGNSESKSDCYVMVISEDNGDVENIVSIGGAEDDNAPKLAIGTDRMFFATDFSGSMDVAGVTQTSTGGSDLLLVSLKNDGTPVDATIFGSVNDDYLTSLSALNNTIVASGIYNGTMLNGTNDLFTSTGGTYDAFIGKVDNISDVTTDIKDGLSENVKSTLYPNPTTDVFYVKDADKVDVYSYTGVVVLSQKNPTQVSIGHLPNGVYLVNLHKGNKVSTVKLIKR